MRESLLKWISDADALRYMDRLGARDVPLSLGYQNARKDDLYISLVGELFDRLRDADSSPADWSLLANALGQFAAPDRAKELRSIGISQIEATLFSATAFYFGGFPASAYLTARTLRSAAIPEVNRACVDLLARPIIPTSKTIEKVRSALVEGQLEGLLSAWRETVDASKQALKEGPAEWISLRLLETLLARFSFTNVRSVLPDGYSAFWTPLVASLAGRGTWDFFPSQIDAIQRGLLTRADTFSLQMPTGAGKTTLCETLLFHHLTSRPAEAAVFLVPYRALASELRSSLISHLNQMGISSRCAYGGTVPSGDEIRAFDETRALVATPETLSGILSANPGFASRISLVICDEGHLLDADSRGVGLELLLARLKAAPTRPQRFVFVSAIVPNIEEVNAWLGGSDHSVVRSTYRPAIAEFALLKPAGSAANHPWDLEMHPHEQEPLRYSIQGFLRAEDFRYRNPNSGRMKSYGFGSFSTRAIATARKALSMGTAVVFAANKRGNQGAIGLSEELLEQLACNLPMPVPLDFANAAALAPRIEYLEKEFGDSWVGTRLLKSGAILHHGDIPQETREVLERLLRDRDVGLAICTSTLAEGVNLPIRTLVLYSVHRLGPGGGRTALLTREIKNLVGRAGRAGSTTKGLVVCVNPDQWPLIKEVAEQAEGEPVYGALRQLVEVVRDRLAARNLTLTNELLERSPIVHALVDGVDATLIDLAAIEIGENELAQIAIKLADQTFASSQTNEGGRRILREVFSLRAQRIAELQANGRAPWIRETGARVRMLTLVETGLMPLRERWDNVESTNDPTFVDALLGWAWTQSDLQSSTRQAFRSNDTVPLDTVRDRLFAIVKLWIAGASFAQIAEASGVQVDDLLSVYTKVMSFSLQTVVEQGLALLEKLLAERSEALSPVARRFSEHLRFGTPSAAGITLASGGVVHRRGYVELGGAIDRLGTIGDDRRLVFDVARRSLDEYSEGWRSILGNLVFERTTANVARSTRRRQTGD